MKTLFVESEEMELRYERQSLLIYKSGQYCSSVPVSALERVVVSPHITLKSGVLGLLSEHNVALFVFNARHPGRSAYLSVGEIGDAHRRVNQYKSICDPIFCLNQSIKLVKFKLLRQQRFLLSAMRKRADLRFPLTKAYQEIARLIELLSTHEIGNIDSLRGVEGAAAASFFRAYKCLFAPSLGFSVRNRRPPKDPVNALLSLGYTLIYHESVSAIKSAGLDPMLGFYHKISHGRASLACDLVEIVREHVETLVWRLFQERTLRAESFHKKGEACFLSSSGKSKFYSIYLDWAPTVRRLLRSRSRAAAHLIDGVQYG